MPKDEKKKVDEKAGDDGTIMGYSVEAVEYILQKHEEYRYENDIEGVKSTVERCFGPFKKLFPGEDLNMVNMAKAFVAYLQKNGLWGKGVIAAAEPTAVSPAGKERFPERNLEPFPHSEVRVLLNKEDVRAEIKGDEFEMCKSLACKFIGVIPQSGRGRLNTSNLLVAACWCTGFPEECPQRASFTGKEEILFKMFEDMVGEEKARVMVLRMRMLDEVTEKTADEEK